MTGACRGLNGRRAQTLDLMLQGYGISLLEPPVGVFQREAAIRLQLARWSAETGQADKDTILGEAAPPRSSGHHGALRHSLGACQHTTTAGGA